MGQNDGPFFSFNRPIFSMTPSIPFSSSRVAMGMIISDRPEKSSTAGRISGAI
jgi:hypothetical protein